MIEDIRWKQRFQNFERAFLFLKKSKELKKFDELQRAGLIQSFEFTFELAWKTLKDYLQMQGVEAPFPREVIKQAFAVGLIEDGALWLQMLDKRNQLTHTYNEKQAQSALNSIIEIYYPLMEKVYNKLIILCMD